MTKPQIPIKSQGPIPKAAGWAMKAAMSEFGDVGIWSLEIDWDLGLGHWILIAIWGLVIGF